LNAPVSKTGMGVSVHRGFESPPLRQNQGSPGPSVIAACRRPPRCGHRWVNAGQRTTITFDRADGQEPRAVECGIETSLPTPWRPGVGSLRWVRRAAARARHGALDRPGPAGRYRWPTWRSEVRGGRSVMSPMTVVTARWPRWPRPPVALRGRERPGRSAGTAVGLGPRSCTSTCRARRAQRGHA
jgi:hypothetical protein